MSSFEDRKKNFEKKFAHDEELKFKVNSKRNKYLGEWAAEDRKIAGKPAEDATPKHIDVEEIEAMLAQQSDDFFKH